MRRGYRTQWRRYGLLSTKSQDFCRRLVRENCMRTLRTEAIRLRLHSALRSPQLMSFAAAERSIMEDIPPAVAAAVPPPDLQVAAAAAAALMQISAAAAAAAGAFRACVEA